MYDMTWKISSRSLDLKHLLNEESLFFNGNGYLGVRGNFEESYDETSKTIRGTYINAFHDIVDITYGEKLYAFPDNQQKLLNIIDAQTTEVYISDEESEEVFSLFQGEVLDYKRHLYLDRGYTERKIHWRSPHGKEVNISFKRLVSFTEKEAFIQEITIEPLNFSGKVRLSSSLDGDVSNFVDPTDPRVSSGHAKRLNVTQCDLIDDLSYVEVETYVSHLKAACGTVYHIDSPAKREDSVQSKQIITQFETTLTKKVTFQKSSFFVDTLRHGDELKETVISIKDRLEGVDFKKYANDQMSYLKDFWYNSDVIIEGDPDLQEGIRFNLFSLLQSAGRDRLSNIAAKGLSGEGYEGHYFWDTEIYMFPVFLMTNPEIARQLLLYRYSILNDARDRAKEMGHAKGALFPWRTISGTESSPYFPAGTAQYHISADIAYSFIQYYMATHDVEFIQNYGAEVLFETARLWLEIGHFINGEFRIDDVTGPDEYTCIVNNNYYTNAMAKHNLKWAVKVYQLLSKESPEMLQHLIDKISFSKEEVKAWTMASENMLLPIDEELQINPQDDTFLQKAVWDIENTPKNHFPLLLHYHPLTLYRYQVCKQADTVLSHFLLEDEQHDEIIKNSYDYYEKITTHDSSLSSCVFSIMASKVGYHEKAYDYFIETARLDLDNTHGNTKDGLHMANMGGTWLAIVFGFAGLRLKEEGIYLNPYLPKAWKGYKFSIQYQGKHLKVNITKEKVTIEMDKNSEGLTLHVQNIAYEVHPNKALEIRMVS